MGLGTGELILVLIIILILFGAGKIPQVMKSLGKGIKEFKDAQNEVDTIAELKPMDEEKKDDGSKKS